MTKFPIHAKTLHGLEKALAAELIALGAEDVAPGNRVVTFSGDQRLLYRANAFCRTAIRFLKPIHTFAAEDEKQLYAGVQEVRWGRFLTPKQSLWIDPLVHSSFCTHSRYAAQLAKDAIVDQLRTASGQRPSVERFEPDLRVGLYLVQNQATIYLDSSGESLHKRGYRKAQGDAPLNEVLAAGILQLTKWQGETPLIDPMCGSGTLLIEAAMRARNLAPILVGRDYAFAQWPDFDRQQFGEVFDEAKSAARDSADAPIVGGDIDPKMVEIARENAKWAGVAGDLEIREVSFECAAPPGPETTLVTNPPYDARLKVDQTAKLYKRIGDALKQRFAGSTAWLLTGNLEAAKQIGLRTSRRIQLFNGPIECRLLKFDLYAGSRREGADSDPKENSDITATEETTSSKKSRSQQVPAKWQQQSEMFRNRLTRMAKHWGKWARKQGVTCYRLYDKDIPDVPLAIDWYEGRLHIAEYVRPHDRAEAEHRAWLDFILDSAADALEVPRKQVFVKLRKRQSGKSQYDRQSDRGRRFEVSEGGHTFLVNLTDYLDTGLFLDHRQTRAMVQEEAAGKTFLNLFGYTGAFSVYAAAGGAVSTTTVDLSNTYLDWAKDNMQLNGFTQPQHRFVRDYVSSFVRRRAEAGESPIDLAVVDPPTFSNSKRLDEVWDVQKEYAPLLNMLLLQMASEGVVYFSTNQRRFKFDEQEIVGAQVREISRQTVPPDFRNRRIHRCWKLRK